MKKQAYNPFLPNYEYIPDGEPYVFNDRVYIYGSHDRFDGENFCLNNYVCYSASVDDLSDWKFEGEIFDKKKDPIYNAEHQCLFAPDVCKGNDGRYYLYYVLNGAANCVSVAVCDTPAGTYEFYAHIKDVKGGVLGQRDGDIFQFDPAVIFENNKVYLYTGFCWNDKPDNDRLGCMCTELELDMKTVKKEPVFVIPNMDVAKGTDFEGHAYFEGPSIRFINGLYFLVYSSVNGHELCYATSKYPNKDFKYKGTIVSNGDVYLNGRTWEDQVYYTGNNHGGLVQIKNEWYIFYHRQTNGNLYSRQACAEKVTIDKSNFIKQVEITSCGLNGGPLLGVGVYPASIACCLYSANGATTCPIHGKLDNTHPVITQEGEDREHTENQYIKNLQNNSVFGFKYFDLTNTKNISLSIKGTAMGKIEIYVDDKMNNKIGELNIIPSKNYSIYDTSIAVNKIVPLYFRFKGEGNYSVDKLILK